MKKAQTSAKAKHDNSVWNLTKDEPVTIIGKAKFHNGESHVKTAEKGEIPLSLVEPENWDNL